MCSSQRIEIRVNSLKCEIREIYWTRSKDGRLRDGPNFKRKPSQVRRSEKQVVRLES